MDVCQAGIQSFKQVRHQTIFVLFALLTSQVLCIHNSTRQPNYEPFFYNLYTMGTVNTILTNYGLTKLFCCIWQFLMIDNCFSFSWPCLSRVRMTDYFLHPEDLTSVLSSSGVMGQGGTFPTSSTLTVVKWRWEPSSKFGYVMSSHSGIDRNIRIKFNWSSLTFRCRRATFSK